MNHPLRDYVGKPWAADGEGPHRFACLAWVRDALRRHGVNLPAVAAQALRQAARPDKPQEWDVVLMRSRFHWHCGLLVRANGRLGVMHCVRGAGVVWQTWAEATAGMTAEIWRPA